MAIKIPIKGALVILCGASCSGKTTLAKQILHEAPVLTKEIVSNDDCFKRIITENPSLPEAQEFRRYGYIVGETASPEFRQLLAGCVHKSYVDALRRSRLVLLEETVSSGSQIQNVLTAVESLVYDREIIVLKLAVARALHSEFYERSGKLSLPRAAVLAQGSMFCMEAQFPQTTTTGEVPESEYYITDPRAVSIKFI